MIDQGSSKRRALALGQVARSTLAMHSAASPDWGTPPIIRHFCASFLRPAANGGAIDLDYASSAYWQSHWPIGTRPSAYLDGSEGRDVLVEADRRAAVKARTCGAGFFNPPGLDGGRMIQRCWEVCEQDHRTGWLGSGAYIGFSLEQLASLQGVGERNPLSCGDGTVITVVPSRRIRYELHPEALIALLRKKQARRERGRSSSARLSGCWPARTMCLYPVPLLRTRALSSSCLLQGRAFAVDSSRRSFGS